jgi:hypothetical protein
VRPGRQRTRAAKEADRGDRLLVGEHLDVGQSGGVVDRDVHVLPAHLLAADAFSVRAAAGGLPLSGLAGEAMPGTLVDPPELLDVDMEQLARRWRP